MRARREDWPEQLDAFIRARASTPFGWGAHDCAMFAADWVRVCCDVDPASPWRGQYTTAAQATTLQRHAGGLEAMITSVLGEPIASAFAQRGDVVLEHAGLGPTAGVSLGFAAAFVSFDGLIYRPLHACVRAWRL